MLALLGWLAVSFVAAAAGAVAARDAGEFYLSLDRPGWAPPGWLFAPVWTVLYFLQGVAAWMVWRARGWSGAVWLFLVQLALNALWTWIFFAWRLGAAAFAEIALLWVLIVATVLAFWRVRAWAGAVLVPYLLWVSFATALTYSAWTRNPHLLGS